MTRRSSLSLLLACLGGLLLPGCVGTLDIWTLDILVPGQGDDDEEPPALDFSTYAGVEMINIDWDQEQKALGLQDCAGEWSADGENTTLDDDNLCEACDHVWTLTLRAEDSAYDCLQNTDITINDPYVRKVGFEFLDDVDFIVWRNFQDQDLPLQPVGEGAIKGTGYTWSGRAEEYRNPGQNFEFFFSGEGEF
jgi:hypothetical protein